MVEASQGVKTGDISNARDSEDEEVRYTDVNGVAMGEGKGKGSSPPDPLCLQPPTAGDATA